jgi:hypothetical protein
MAVAVYPAPGYDSFISLEDANAYLTSLGYAKNVWDNKSTTEREAALRRGTQFIYARRLRPEALWDITTIPATARVHPNVAAATAEAARRHVEGSLYKDLDPAPVLEKTVGPLTLRYGVPTVVTDEAKLYPVITDLLYGLTYTSGAGLGAVTFERV